MKQTLRTLSRILLPAGLRRFLTQAALDLFDEHAQTSYSQEGEDLLLRLLFAYRRQGFYVDVGAHHPQRFSNTWWFYRAGWRGINIDPLPGSMARFRKLRPRDINLEAPIASRPGPCTYFIFDEPALNTFSAEVAEQRRRAGRHKLLARKTFQSRRLDDVLDQYLAPDTPLDFLSVDTEGLDLDVLQSNSWMRYRPKVVLAETPDPGRRELADTALDFFLKDCGYVFFAKTFHTVFYLERAFRDQRFRAGLENI